jgi:tetratricopeptide (TPR) repeat protein
MDPYFDVAVSDVRGFDLGDDAELLTDLHGRRVAAPEQLSGDDWMLLGVLGHRAGDDEEAGRCFERAAGVGHHPALCRYLQAQLRLHAGRHEEAEALLDLAEEANEAANPAESTTGVPPAELVHARGTMLRVRGDLEGALAQYRSALEIDPGSALRWVETAEVLAQLQRWNEALEAARRARLTDPELRRAAYLSAAYASRIGDTAAALDILDHLARRDATVAARASHDPHFEALRGEPAFVSLTAPRSATNVDWLDAFPGWFQRLRGSEAVAALGLQWLDEDESLRRTATWAEIYAASSKRGLGAEGGPTGTLHTAATLELSRTMLQGRRIVARGPATRRREGTEEPSWILIDVRKPESLLVALSEAYPPFLWLDGGATAETLAAALGEFFPQPDLSRLQLTEVARGFMGYRLQFGVPSPYTGGIEPANALELDHHFALNPFLETASWGSAYADDPWPAVIPQQPGFEAKFSERQRKVSQQARGAVWSITRRTRHSRSYLCVELHHRDVFVLEVRYRPSRQIALVDRLNNHFGCDYPLDMPPDAIGAMLGFRFDSAGDLLAQVDATAHPDEIAGLLTVISALRHSDLSMVRVYRRYMDHPDPVVRTTLCNVFAAYNFESLLEEMTVLEPDPEIAAQLERLLDEGIPVTELDPYSDYATDDDESSKDATG